MSGKIHTTDLKSAIVAQSDDELFVFLLAVLIVAFEYLVVPIQNLGFQCKDPNLSHPFNGDTITITYLFVVSIGVPLIAILLIESIAINSTEQTYFPMIKKMNPFKKSQYWYKKYYSGLFFLILLIQASKCLIAAPRPHFFDTCKPDKAINCTTEFFFEYKCTNINIPKQMMYDSLRSFPSGHAAMGMYMALFMIWFLQIKIPRRHQITVAFFQCIFFSWGLFCGLSRLTDRRHHWWDILGGSILGLCVAAFLIRFSSRNISSDEKKLHKPDKNLNDTGDINHAWNKKLLSSVTSCSQNSDERELREVK
ncbi:Lipid phosphate phosphohydrolase, putative [Pediculus humanus corporis]|uniref:Lipid phosphate phosphohydrolase, putative n=1 Tax=Pediculus humanus subsp. corporis TaxID=121224 RepID=E0W2J4_PEDHC|nr:Lipid phosphate phosphohydrolase, putative [Pediculus humanus corporis]EEB19850.1 Lipid phosphate phosphohydrolase, putative [Pediculus humanus corporis]